jgi:murein DD-endopeptidase MepM/ murein hydrolase activator NlpD
VLYGTILLALCGITSALTLNFVWSLGITQRDPALGVWVTPDARMLSAAAQQPLVATAVPQVAVAMQDSVFTVTGFRGRAEVVTYTVLHGDSLLDIAEQYDLTYCTLVWSNPQELLSPLLPGTQLTIPPVDGLMFTPDEAISIAELAAQTGVAPDAIIYSPQNHDLLYADAAYQLPIGIQVMIPGGDGGDCIPWERPPWLRNDDGGDDALKGCDYINQFTGYPTNAPLNHVGKFARGFNLGIHDGIDHAAPLGTPVYAAGDGMVRYAGWHSDGYGQVIVIDHGGSYSIYGHLDTINVNCGQPVAARQFIGGVGSTGNSNGDHLHFEVRDGSFTPIDPEFAFKRGF